MWRAYMAEWPKIRRRGVLLAALAMIAVSALGAGVAIERIPSRHNGALLILGLDADGGLVSLLLHGSEFLSLIVISTVAAVFASEWSQGTLRNLLLQEPGRLRFLSGKFLATLTFLLIATALSMAVGIGVAARLAPGIGVHTGAWWTSDGLTLLFDFLGNLAIAVIGWSVLGTFVAVLLRDPAGAVGAALVWFIGIENLTTAIWPDVGPWLPGHLLGALLQGGTPAVSYGSALTFSIVYAAGMTIVTALLFRLRDVLA